MVILGLPLADHTGFVGAASRYIGLKTVMQLLGPMQARSCVWTPKAPKHMTDYARILRAFYAFAHIRITRTCRLPCK
ncbi:hypothetical protein HID58_072134 [Brassica napus]|uniref:Uncharacterized protein n=1 Tax=Brassica napus TaxID=3708 RepID=A0ABQ7Z3K4_BRANA|nr:hypothetical protein HID58_072134 [Brassica napus]